MNLPLLRSDLNIVGCGCDGPCERPIAHYGKPQQPIKLGNKCHPDTPVWLFYESGILRVVCALCHEVVTLILVAETRPAPPPEAA